MRNLQKNNVRLSFRGHGNSSKSHPIPKLFFPVEIIEFVGLTSKMSEIGQKLSF